MVALPVAGLLWTVACGDDDGDGDGDAGSGGVNAGSGGAGRGGASGAGGGVRAGASGGGASGGGASGSGATSGSGASGGEMGGATGEAGAGGAIAGAGGDAGSGAGEAGRGGEGGVSSCSVTPPDEYDATPFAANTGAATDVQRLVDGWSALVSAANMPTGLMAVAEVALSTTPAPTPPNAAAMLAAFEAGTPSLEDASTEAFQGLVANVFEQHEQASLATWDGTPAGWDHAAAPANQGGLWQPAGAPARVFNERGIETRTLVALGSFAGVFYNYARSLLEDEITPGTIDVIARAFGVDNPAFPGAPLPAGAYTRTANYAFSIGLMAPVKRALIDAQAYAADPACTRERDAAIADVFAGWERASMGRAVLYTHRADLRASTAGGGTSSAEADYQAALHQLAEGAALAAGWRGIADKIITEAQLADLLAELQHGGLPGLGAVNAYVLSGNDVTALNAARAQLQAALVRLQNIYGFTPDEMTRFKSANPTPG